MNSRPGSKYGKKVTVKASSADPNKQMKITDEANLGKLRSIRIEPAENGFSVTSDHHPKQNVKRVGKPTGSPKSYGVDSYTPPQTHVFEDHQGVLDHVKQKLTTNYE